MAKIKYEYEVPLVPGIAGTRNKLNAQIQNTSERIKAIENYYKPNVSFMGEEAIFYFQVYDYVKENTFTALKKNCMDIVKVILKQSCNDIFDNTGTSFKYDFVDDNVQVVQSKGGNSKSYMDYRQTWKLTEK